MLRITNTAPSKISKILPEIFAEKYTANGIVIREATSIGRAVLYDAFWRNFIAL
jgi:hypothetical protein